MHTQGRPYTDKADELGTAIREFNEAVRKDDRVEVVATPFRDGVSIIMRKCACISFGSSPAPSYWATCCIKTPLWLPSI